MNKLKVVGVLVVVAACSKKAADKKEPESTPKIVEKKPTEPPPSPPRLVFTSKSKEAIAEMEKARDLMANLREAEAIELLKKAIQLDPELALAHSFLGLLTPGTEGTDMLHKAGTLAATASEPEKKLVEAHQAMRAGDTPKAMAALQKVIELAPGEWPVELALANMDTERRETDAAIKRLEHALSVKPDLATAYNGLAYAHASKRNWEPAIAAAQKQVELLPKEPNPVDTLAEMQLLAGKFEEAEKTFMAALTVEPKFFLAWNGVAIARGYRGDYKGAIEALDKQKEGATEPFHKFGPTLDAAMFAAAQDKVPEALAILDSIEKDPTTKKFPIYAFAQVMRGHVLTRSGKYADGVKAYETALKRAAELAGDARLGVQRGYRAGRLMNAAFAGKPAADADKLVAAIEEDAKANMAGTVAQDEVAYAKGLAAWAKSGPKDAVAELSKCDVTMIVCRYDLAVAQRKSGDAAAAEATEKSIRELPQRNVGAIWVWTHLPKAN